MGRNSAFDHAGNVAIAVAAGAVGYLFSQRAVFMLVPVFALLCTLAVLSIPHDAVDYNRAARPKPGRDRRFRQGGRLRSPVSVSAAFDLLCVRLAVPFCQCAAAASGRAEAGSRTPEMGGRHDVVMHRGRAVGDAADRHPCRTHCGRLGS
jgi:hypothetical protein